MKKNRMKLSSSAISLLLFMGFAVFSCREAPVAAASSSSDELILRTYQVPTPYGPEVGGIIKSLLSKGSDLPPLGKVAISPSGEILVAAPKAFHPGIEQFLAGLAKASPAPPPSIRIDYWFVRGNRALKGQGSNSISEIPDVLASISQSQGPMDFDLIERMSVISVSGEMAKNDGAQISASQVATAYGDRVVADLHLNFERTNGLSTRVQIPVDKTLVLGQSNFRANQKDKTLVDQGRDSSVFYVIRAQVVRL